MTRSELLEAIMLAMFSAGWCWSILRTLRLRSATGKSLTFIAFVATGYIAGVTAKLVAWHEDGALSPVIWVYTWILALILIDLALSLRFGAGGASRYPVR